MEGKEKRILNKIKEVKDSILKTISDDSERRMVQDKIATLLSLQAQSDVEEVELVVPTKSVIRSADFGTYYIKQTTSGILFGIKGGLSTFIDIRQKKLCDMFVEFLDMRETDYADVDEENRELFKNFFDIWCVIMQTPLYCVLSPNIAVQVAQCNITGFCDFAKENINEAKLQPETSESVATQIEDEQQTALVKALFDSLPEEKK